MFKFNSTFKLLSAFILILDIILILYFITKSILVLIGLSIFNKMFFIIYLIATIINFLYLLYLIIIVVKNKNILKQKIKQINKNN